MLENGRVQVREEVCGRGMKQYNCIRVFVLIFTSSFLIAHYIINASDRLRLGLGLVGNKNSM